MDIYFNILVDFFVLESKCKNFIESLTPFQIKLLSKISYEFCKWNCLLVCLPLAIILQVMVIKKTKCEFIIISKILRRPGWQKWVYFFPKYYWSATILTSKMILPEVIWKVVIKINVSNKTNLWSATNFLETVVHLTAKIKLNWAKSISGYTDASYV